MCRGDRAVEHAVIYKNKNAKLSDKEASVTGFRKFLMAHHFLWTYPSNAIILGRRFKVCESYASGPYLWKWIEKIAALKVRKIVWPKRSSDSDAKILILTVDGLTVQSGSQSNTSFRMIKDSLRRKRTMSP
jgi:hypothetical protein